AWFQGRFAPQRGRCDDSTSLLTTVVFAQHHKGIGLPPQKNGLQQGNRPTAASDLELAQQPIKLFAQTA
ncbi:hypothetical protein, partial [Pseudomonas sp. SDO5271_S396]